MKTIAAGRYRWQVTLQQLPAVPARNEFNEPSYATWTPIVTVWAAISTLSGRELEWARQIVADATVKVETRFWPGVIPKMRWLYADKLTGKQRIFGILWTDDSEERHRQLVCLCKESV